VVDPPNPTLDGSTYHSLARFPPQTKVKASNKKTKLCQAWWYTPIIPALKKLKQKDCEFEDSLDCRIRPFLKKTKSYEYSKGLGKKFRIIENDRIRCEKQLLVLETISWYTRKKTNNLHLVKQIWNPRYGRGGERY
jgi:hypothetical protein